MILGSHQFTLSNECLEAMKGTLDRTKVKERGFGLCENSEVTPGREVIGGRGSITIRNCTTVKDAVVRKRPPVGFYHTHPESTSRPSWWDALSVISRSISRGKPWLDCRGGRADNMVRCDTVKDIPSTQTYENLKKRRLKMAFKLAEQDPEIWQYFTNHFSFAAKDIPEIIKPTGITEKHFVGIDGRRFIRYFDTIRRRQWTVEVK